MTQKGRFKDSKNSDDFDLDSYLEEQSREQPKINQQPIVEEHETSFMKNTILGVALLFTSFMWYHDWSPTQAYNSIFGGDETRIIATGQAGNQIVIDIPEIRLPDININQQQEIERAIENELARAGVSDASLPSVTDYLVELKDKGLLDDGKLSAFQARQLHEGGVPISYIEQVDKAGYLDDLNFVAITEFYKNDIPLSYIQQYEEADILDKVNFVGIDQYYRNGVTMEYLQTLDKAGYLDDLSYVHVSEYYRAGVTPSFLDGLKEKGLYNDLNFIDVVELYKSENN